MAVGSPIFWPSAKERGVFRLTEDEIKKADAWMALQLTKNPKIGIFADRFTFSFTPTSIGTPIFLVDNLTKDQIELTEDVEW